MPCYVTGTAEGDARLAADDARQAATRLSELLCMQLRALDETGHENLIHGAVRPWWDEHKRIDQERVEAEKTRRETQKIARAAKRKLTGAERRALGLE